MLIRLDLAMNDEQGYPTGKARMIHAYEYHKDRIGNRNGEMLYTLEPYFYDDSIHCEIWNGAMQLKLSRKVFPILSYRFNVGNQFWNNIVVDNGTHALIFQYLKTMKYKNRKTGKEYPKWQIDDCLDEWLQNWNTNLNDVPLHCTNIKTP